MSLQAEIGKSIYSGFIDHQRNSLDAYQPKLLINDYKNGQKVLTSIVNELNACDEFFFSVAFITQSGITVLLNTLKELEERQIKGKVLASQYLNFTNPIALERLLEFSNIDLRIVVEGNHHSKGYIFRKSDSYSLIVGSSNLTQEALSSNKEWNIKVSSMESGSLIIDTLAEFQKTFLEAQIIDHEWIVTYKKIYEVSKPIFHNDNKYSVETSSNSSIYVFDESPQYRSNVLMMNKIIPNKMQVNALRGIETVRVKGENKAILISATGTGKTYLAAFDVRKVNPKKFLFLVHREQILDQAIESFKNVLGQEISIGKLSGRYKETNKRFLFSTVQTMSRDDILNSFESDAFDYVVLDETHRSGADSYQKILRHLKPGFLLGMTATPDRTDGYNIYQDFNHNIAYEIRLQQAMEENMLCPFHYFGVMEIMIDGQTIQDNSEFKYLVSEERVRHIIDKIKFYGFFGKRVKGLVFCSTNNEAGELAQRFCENGFNAISLSGRDSQDYRDKAINRLEQDKIEGGLDYIFTVDIFNEGVDIPKINQVIMLRPTQSAIIFVQQLGRGLRKHSDKEYVVVIDFIGNYKNNFLIPMALAGDRSYNKDSVRRYVMEGTRVIPGCSTINFEAISRKRIFEAIDQANFSDIKIIRESYQTLKYQLGRIPNLKDFEEFGSIDVTRIFDHKNVGSYHKFLKKNEPEYLIELSNVQEEMLEFISKKLANGKRMHELALLKQMLLKENDLLEYLKSDFMNQNGIRIEEKTITSVINVLTNNFITGTARNTYQNCVFIEPSDTAREYQISTLFKAQLKDINFKLMLEEIIDFGLYRNRKYYSDRYKDTNLQLYQKYTYEDVCRLLEWEKAEVALNIGGYKFDKKTKTYPVFINYEKGIDISDSTNYEDRFVSTSELIAISKSGRTTESEDVLQAYRAEADGVLMCLFVRKNKDDSMSKEFYYLGTMNTYDKPHQFILRNTDKTAVEIRYRLHTPIREELFEYITG